MFCEEHFGVEDHSCASDLAGDRVVIVSCPVCAKAIRVEVGQNPDAVMEAHIGGKCKGPKVRFSLPPRKHSNRTVATNHY